MATAWPSFPGQATVPQVEPFEDVLNFESLGGSEWQLAKWAGGKRRYTFRYNGLRTGVAAPAPYAAYSEAGAVLYLLEQAHGSVGRFDITDPITAATVTCRLDATTKLEPDPDGSPWYSGEVVFVSVF